MTLAGARLLPAVARTAACGLALSLAAGAAVAHVPGPLAAPDEPLSWNRDLDVVLPLAVSALAYALGVARAWRCVGIGRGIGRGHVAAFAGGWLALCVALVTPLDALGAWLFSAHMVQHELMMVVAAPLLCLGRPLVAWLWLLPSRSRGAVVRGTRARAWAAPWRALTGLAAAWTIHAAVLWGWHLPRFFEAALLDEGWHTLQHLAFLGSALIFWWPVLRPGTGERLGPVLPYLFTTMLHTGALGALLAMSPLPWYPTYLERAPALGVDPLEDQQLGGLVMWLPAGLAYVAAGLALAARWIGFRDEAARAGADAPNA